MTIFRQGLHNGGIECKWCMKQEAQLSQRGPTTLSVVGNLAMLLKITQGHSY